MSDYEKQLAAWEAFRVALRKAEATGDMADGMAARRALKEFNRLFVGDSEDTKRAYGSLH